MGKAGWYSNNSEGQTQSAGGKTPNELGIYDMSGNAWEWCKDWYGPYTAAAQSNLKGASSGVDRVLRGGCWGNSAARCRVSSRYGSDPSRHGNIVGFRVMLSQ